MHLFFFFLTRIGVTVILLGMLSRLVSELFSLPEIPNLFLQAGIMFFFFIEYARILEKIFLNIYKKMGISYKNLTLKKKIFLRITLPVFMAVHFYGSVWLFYEISSPVHAIFVILFLSLSFGIAIKGWFDGLFAIQTPNYRKNMI
jgi:hypothetical protein